MKCEVKFPEGMKYSEMREILDFFEKKGYMVTTGKYREFNCLIKTEKECEQKQ